LIPGSTYRGEVELTILKYYSILCCLPLLLFFLSEGTKRTQYSEGFRLNGLGIRMINLHLGLVYVCLFGIIAKYGLVILNQESRFDIDGFLSYIVKSSIYVPPIYFLANFSKKASIRELFLYYFLPLFPAIFIGSRGTVVMIIFCLIIIKIIKDSQFRNHALRVLKSKNNLRILFLSSIFAFAILVGFSIIRRANSSFLSSTEDLINTYFGTSNIFLYLFFPFHIGLREQIGISNIIITGQYTNPLPYSLFFADMYTVLPGKQPSSGITINEMLTGNTHAGLTPGILGGTYLDIGIISLFSVFFLVLMLETLFRRAKSNDVLLLLYTISVVQFFHLFHRGLFKPEYLVAYIVIFCYIKFGSNIILRVKRK